MLIQEERHHSSVLADTVSAILARIGQAELIATTAERIGLSFGDLGQCLFAKRQIKAGEVILMFTGPTIGFEQAVAKGERECWPLQIGKGSYIDLEEPGCYANHSCDPNSGVVLDRFLVAIRDIPRGTEVRYDYSTTVDEDHWSMMCRCKSLGCRRIISDFKYLEAETRRKYLSLGIVQDFISSQYQLKNIPLLCESGR